MSKSHMNHSVSLETRNKISIVHKGQIIDKHWRQKISKSCKGRKAWNKGLPMSEKSKHKLSEVNKGSVWNAGKKKEYNSSLMKASIKQQDLWKDRAYAKRILHRRPMSFPEQKFEHFCIDEGLPFRFVGNGVLVIDGKNPDFVGTEDQTLLIEIWGERWHLGQDPNDRIRFFSDRGYKCIVVYAKELSEHYRLLERVNSFITSR